MPPQIVLDAETFKVLASDTRLAILKKLDERPMTVSELARDLSLNKATVFEHLNSLTVGDLVKKKEREGRKWVYYTLTWKGKSLLHPENTTVMVLLGLAALGSSGAMLQLGHYVRWWGIGLVSDGADAPKEGTETPTPGPMPFGASKTADDAETADSSGPEDNQMTAPVPEEEAGHAADSDAGGFWDFLESTEFWVMAVLFLVSSVLFTASYVVKSRARGRPTVMSKAVEEAEVRLKE